MTSIARTIARKLLAFADSGSRKAAVPSPEVTNAGDNVRLLHSIDRYSLFCGTLKVAGWAFTQGHKVQRIELRVRDGRSYELVNHGLESPDVARHHGPAAARCRFDEVIHVTGSRDAVVEATLVFHLDGGRTVEIPTPGARNSADPTRHVQREFFRLLNQRPEGRVLEVGSRARSGVTRRGLAPKHWSYTGLDIVAGENVDVVGDAHQLSRLFGDQRFDAVMAFSVLEHLLMPWKFVVELNRVLNPGALGLFATHQCWPIHDEPWDFWRFSDTAWAALLNRATGFEIVAAVMGEPAYVVANMCHPVTNFAEVPNGYLASAVLFRKIGDTTLDWPVEVGEVTATAYPT